MSCITKSFLKKRGKQSKPLHNRMVKYTVNGENFKGENFHDFQYAKAVFILIM